ncbi:MAG: DNA-processing protein DprA [Eggerthellaceae bacterium]|jgi:DNA processing protein|nr:DNA-processing protein DprA [Eggerthellaceae bacterium]MDR2716302.1 DNA-processing protein DprA [Coriobacteriaceae bacterium]
MHKKARYPRYKGPKVAGERFVLHEGMDGYPDAFRQIADPPGALYVIGDRHALVEGLAVIGARKATPYGIACARLFADRAAERGVTVISGGAYGCDSAAHRAAVERGRPTVVFLGGGLDELYPAAHRGLFQEVVDAGGALVSENAWDYPPLPHTFRARNRLIAGLARATLIVEAGLPSGTFSTADEALAANREVLVVPGSITSAASRGANRLLYQGATPVVGIESFDDILSSLFCLPEREHATGGGPREGKGVDALLGALQASPLRMDELLALVEAEGAPDAMESLMTRLAGLQKLGAIARYPDGRYGPARV